MRLNTSKQQSSSFENGFSFCHDIADLHYFLDDPRIPGITVKLLYTFTVITCNSIRVDCTKLKRLYRSNLLY